MSVFEIIFSLVFIFVLFNTIPTLLMSFLVLKPLANARENDPVKQKKLFWKYFWIRMVILLVLCFFTVFTVLTLDFIICIIMAIFVVPKQKNMVDNSIQAGQMTNPSVVTTSQTQNLNASVSNPQVVVNNVQPQEGVETRKPVLPTSFDPMYRNTEEKMLEIFINKELQKAKINKYIGLIPTDALKRKKIMNVIILFLIFVLVSMIFFHFPIYSYIIGAIIILIVYKTSRKFDLTMYLKKEIKARPSEKISNIIMNAKNTLVKDDSKIIFLVGTIIAIVLPLIIFIKPRIIYEKMDNGYGVRFYTFGLTNFTSATIPETYKGEKVVSLRGNTFSNMFFLKEINLPDSIIEIRGQAFKNLYQLEEIKLPSKLEYLGGGAFYNCKKLKSIVIPDTVTELGGEVFYNAESLESVKLSTNLTEIRGNTFENCSSLKSITIPDKVTRIGGHAFYGNSLLNEVIISENSQLREIGSSAFRVCTRLYKITLPEGVYVNERAFKESPTVITYVRNGNNQVLNNLEKVQLVANETKTFQTNNIKVTYIPHYTSYINNSCFCDGTIVIEMNGEQYEYFYEYKIGYYDNDLAYQFDNYHIKVDLSSDYIEITLSDFKNFNNYTKREISLGDNLIINNNVINLKEIINNSGDDEFIFSVNNQEVRLTSNMGDTVLVNDNLLFRYSGYRFQGIYMEVYYN